MDFTQLKKFEKKDVNDLTELEAKVELQLRRIIMKNHEEVGDERNFLLETIEKLELNTEQCETIKGFAQNLRLSISDKEKIVETFKRQLCNFLFKNIQEPCRRYEYMVVSGKKTEECFPYCYKYFGGYDEFMRIRIAMDLMFKTYQEYWKNPGKCTEEKSKQKKKKDDKGEENTAGQSTTVATTTAQQEVAQTDRKSFGFLRPKSRHTNKNKKFSPPKSIEEITYQIVEDFIREKGAGVSWDDRTTPYVHEDAGSLETTPKRPVFPAKQTIPKITFNLSVDNVNEVGPVSGETTQGNPSSLKLPSPLKSAIKSFSFNK